MALSGNESTSQLTSCDLETLANIQAELDRIGSSNINDNVEEEQADAASPIEVETSTVTISSSSTFKVVNSEVCADVENVIVESQPMPTATPSPPDTVVDPPVKLDASRPGTLEVNTVVTKDGVMDAKVLKPFFIIPSRTLGVTVTSSASGEDTVNRLIFTTTSPISTVSSSGSSKPIIAPRSVGDGKTLSALMKGQLMTSTSGGSPVITKVIFTNNPLTGQSSTQTVSLAPGSPLAAAVASAGQNAVITGLSQPLKIVTASSGHLATTSGKTVTLTQSGMGSPVKQQILTAIPNTTSKQTIMVSKIALSPKTPTKIFIPVSVGKSPQKIAPAPLGSNMQLVTKANILTALTAASTTTTMTTTAPKIGTLALSPSKLFIKQPVSQTVTVKQGALPSVTSAITNNTGANIKHIAVSTSAGVQPIQVPGSKFSYIRLVTAAAPSATTTIAGSKAPTTALATVSRPIASAASQTSQQLQVSASSQVKIAVPISPVTSGQLIGQPRVAPKHMTGQRILIPATNMTQMRPASGSIAVPASALTQLPPGTTLFSPSGNLGNIGNIVMVPAQYVAQFQQQVTQGQNAASSGSSTVITTSSQPTLLPAQIITQQSSGQPPSSSSSSSASSQERCQSQPSSKHQINGRSNMEPNGVRPRKPCNCTKSQCLKLYCDCFANGEFCHNCNCNNCYNNLEHEEERQKAIKACLERNPQAFHPKIGKGRDGDIERRHNKGCNCKRSGCLKNYCECYEAKIMCSYMCKCIGCKNIAESAEKKTLMHLADAAEVRVQQQTAAKSKLSFQMQDVPSKPPLGSATGERLPSSFITTEVVEATCQCLLAQAETAREKAHNEVVVEQLVLQEFGRCLLQIIEYASKTKI